MPLSLPSRFRDFTAPEADRYSLLFELLDSAGLEPASVDLAGSRHIIVGPLSRPQGRSEASPTVLTAHYDRAPGSPGANDNGAAVFQLAAAAGKLREEGARGWRVVFTDKEEAAGSLGLRSQGSYALGRGFRDIGLEDARIYNFDACGRGDTLVVSTAADELLRGSEGAGADRALHALRSLRVRLLRTARALSLRRVLLMPTPFSDDAGFFAAGLAAQTITVLPEVEAERLAARLRGKPALAAQLVNREAEKSAGLSGRLGPLLPRTWKDLNTARDTPETLRPELFPTITALACGLCAGAE